jgi:hypothetical protein
VVESLHAIQTGNLAEGSVARVADCCPQAVDPLQCITKLGGICHLADYPKPTGQCVPNQCKPFAKVCTLMTSLKHQDFITLKYPNDALLLNKKCYSIV